jgi:hypothetical protein
MQCQTPPLRHVILAVARCTQLEAEAALSMDDVRSMAWLFSKDWKDNQSASRGSVSWSGCLGVLHSARPLTFRVQDSLRMLIK